MPSSVACDAGPPGAHLDMLPAPQRHNHGVTPRAAYSHLLPRRGGIRGRIRAAEESAANAIAGLLERVAHLESQLARRAAS
ncbi:MAG TPA: hypothetical protein VM529_26035 [Gemmata sp.]|nr:hypothetical protein [Gemmata sp.]